MRAFTRLDWPMAGLVSTIAGLTVVAVMAIPSAAIAVPAPNHVIITGHVVQAKAGIEGNAIDKTSLSAVKQLGDVKVVLLWLGSKAKVGQEVRTSIAGTAVTDEEGRFAISGMPDSTMRAEAIENDGWLNFFLVTTSADGKQSTEGVSRHWNGKAWSDFAGASARPGFSASDQHKAIFAIDAKTGNARYSQVAADDASIAAWPPAYCSATAESESYNTTVVMEFHNSPDADGHWEYGSTADSDVAVGISTGYNQWNLSGTSHVGNTLGGAIYGNHNNLFGKYVGSTIRYEHGRIEGGIYCASRGSHYIRSVQWTGGTSWVWDVSQYDCLDAPQSGWRDRYEQYTGFTKSTSRAYTFSNAVTVGSPYGSVSLSSTSGYSTRVDMNWYWARNWGYICGNNAKPINAKIVYVY